MCKMVLRIWVTICCLDLVVHKCVFLTLFVLTKETRRGTIRRHKGAGCTEMEVNHGKGKSTSEKPSDCGA